MKFCLIFLFLCGSVVFAQAQKSSVTENGKVYIFGNVVKSSTLDFKEQMTLVQPINEAGGILSKNKRKVAIISRLVPNANSNQKIKIDLKEIEKGRVEDPVLQPFDVIVVMPYKRIKDLYIDVILNSCRLPI